MAYTPTLKQKTRSCSLFQIVSKFPDNDVAKLAKCSRYKYTSTEKDPVVSSALKINTPDGGREGGTIHSRIWLQQRPNVILGRAWCARVCTPFKVSTRNAPAAKSSEVHTARRNVVDWSTAHVHLTRANQSCSWNGLAGRSCRAHIRTSIPLAKMHVSVNQQKWDLLLFFVIS